MTPHDLSKSPVSWLLMTEEESLLSGTYMDDNSFPRSTNIHLLRSGDVEISEITLQLAVSGLQVKYCLWIREQRINKQAALQTDNLIADGSSANKQGTTWRGPIAALHGCCLPPGIASNV